ncbi:MAG TPA: DUF4296 domain-containing protein [Candidatus Egerieousia sp.]|nr:DUF4296 domain-containing protein [Candidatus Egerieousia sp.]
MLVCTAAFSLFLSSCQKDKILSKSKMAEIVGQMYLADQFAKQNPEFSAASDSLLMYKPIFDKYGCTLLEYRQSLAYYLADKDTYSKILKNAEDILQAQLNTLGGGSGRYGSYPVMDSIRLRGGDYVASSPHLRAQRWLVAQDEDYLCNIMDSFATDVPQNSEWWQKNVSINRVKNYVMAGALPHRTQGGAQTSPIQSGVQAPGEGEVQSADIHMSAQAKKQREKFRKELQKDGTINRIDVINHGRQPDMQKEEDRSNALKESRDGKK